MAITFGASNPSQITVNLDALFSQTLQNYSKTLVDNIGKSNAFFYKIINSNFYEGENGGSYIQLPLMYQLATMDSYAGYDELGTTPTDGITSAIYEWRQQAVPIVYSMDEVLKNRERIKDLVKTKIMQAEMGFQEGFITHFLQGSGNGALSTPKVSGNNGSVSIEPIAKLIEYSTTSETVGNIAASSNSWWQNRSKTSAATTNTDFIAEMLNLYNTCSRGTGGSPDLIIMDQTTYELFHMALYMKYRQVNRDQTFPFENIKWMGAVVVWDEKVPNVFAGTTDTTTTTGGTVYMINTKFFRIKHMNGRDFDMLKDENGKSFVKPINGDSRIGHMAWMGNICVNNRRKHGVLGKVARTLTNS